MESPKLNFINIIFSAKEEGNPSFDKLGFPCQIRMVGSTIVSADGKSTGR